MKLILQHRHHQPSAAFAALVEQELTALKSRLRIDEARILIEHQHEASPAFRISAHLATPGPDVKDAAEDHTLRAALTKLMQSIADKVKHRSERRSRRSRSHISIRAVPQPA